MKVNCNYQISPFPSGVDDVHAKKKRSTAATSQFMTNFTKEAKRKIRSYSNSNWRNEIWII